MLRCVTNCSCTIHGALMRPHGQPNRVTAIAKPDRREWGGGQTATPRFSCPHRSTIPGNSVQRVEVSRYVSRILLADAHQLHGCPRPKLFRVTNPVLQVLRRIWPLLE